MRIKKSIPPASVTDPMFRDLVIAYENQLRMRAKKSTQTVVGYFLKRFQVFFASRPFNRQGVEAYTISRQPHATAASINTELSTLCALLAHAVEIGLYPAAPFKIQKLRVGRKRMVKTLTKEDIDKLLSVAPEPYRTLMLVQANTGARVNEVLHLTYKDIDWEDGAINIRAKGDWSTKTREDRVCYVRPHVLAALRALQEQAILKDEWIFVSQYGNRLAVQQTCRQVSNFMKLTGIYTKGLSSHLFRHSVITNLLEQGVELHTVSAIAGHSDPSTTLGYAHANQGRMREAVKKLAW